MRIQDLLARVIKLYAISLTIQRKCRMFKRIALHLLKLIFRMVLFSNKNLNFTHLMYINYIKWHHLKKYPIVPSVMKCCVKRTVTQCKSKKYSCLGIIQCYVYIYRWNITTTCILLEHLFHRFTSNC